MIVEVRPVLVVTQETKIEAEPESYIRSDGFEDFAEQVFNDWPLFEILYRMGRCKLKGFNKQKMFEMGQALVKGHRPIAINPINTYGWRPAVQSVSKVSQAPQSALAADLDIGLGVVLKRNYRGFAIRHDEALVAKEVIDEAWNVSENPPSKPSEFPILLSDTSRITWSYPGGSCKTLQPVVKKTRARIGDRSIYIP